MRFVVSYILGGWGQDVRTLAALAVAVLCLGLLGCFQLPRLSADDIDTVQFWAMLPGSDTKWTAGSDDVDRFLNAYEQTRRVSDDWGTTPTARIDVKLKDGRHLVVWGGAQHFQTIKWEGRQFNVDGDELDALLREIAAK